MMPTASCCNSTSQQVDAIDAAISEIDREVDANVDPLPTAITILTTIPAVGDLSARVIVAEIGNASVSGGEEGRGDGRADVTRGCGRGNFAN